MSQGLLGSQPASQLHENRFGKGLLTKIFQNRNKNTQALLQTNQKNNLLECPVKLYHFKSKNDSVNRKVAWH
jgi:hypothetical protein